MADPERDLIKIDGITDPERCGATDDQCQYKRIPGKTRCPRHRHRNDDAVAERKALRNYRLTKFKQRHDSFVDNPKIKSTREEIGMMRVMIEQQWEAITDEAELIARSPALTTMIDKVSSLIATCHKVEMSSGQLLTPEQVFQIADTLVTESASIIEGVCNGSIANQEAAMDLMRDKFLVAMSHVQPAEEQAD